MVTMLMQKTASLQASIMAQQQRRVAYQSNGFLGSRMFLNLYVYDVMCIPQCIQCMTHHRKIILEKKEKKNKENKNNKKKKKKHQVRVCNIE